MSMLKEYYLQPIAPDPVLSEAEVLRCVRRFVPSAKAMTHIDDSGGEARTYIVDEGNRAQGTAPTTSAHWHQSCP